MEDEMNIKKYYLYRIFKDMMPIYPLYLLMFEEKGLSVTEISVLLILWSVPAIFLEIPTGVLADRWNRKNLIALGALLKALCYLTWILSDGFVLYAVGFILWGVGGTLQSGSEEALLYDSLKNEGQEERFDIALGKGHFLSGFSNILAAVSGGFIGMRFGYQTALILSVNSGIITAVMAFSMKEVNLYKAVSTNNILSEKDGTLKSALFFLLKNKELLLLELLSLLVITTSGILDEYDQLIAKNYGLTLQLIGIWIAIRFMLMSIGSYVARGLRMLVENLFRIKDRMYTLGLLFLVAALFLIISGLVKHIGIMGFYGLYYLILAAGGVLQEDYIQQKIATEGRSTVHSLLSLCQNLYGVFCYGLFAFVVSRTNLHIGLIVCGAYILTWTIIIGTMYKIMKKLNWG